MICTAERGQSLLTANWVVLHKHTHTHAYTHDPKSSGEGDWFVKNQTNTSLVDSTRRPELRARQRARSFERTRRAAACVQIKMCPCTHKNVKTSSGILSFHRPPTERTHRCCCCGKYEKDTTTGLKSIDIQLQLADRFYSVEGSATCARAARR